MLNTIILEDNPLDSAVLEKYCTGNENVNLVSAFSTGSSILEFMQGEKADLLFLDVEVPDFSGLDLLQKLPYHPQVIMTTSNKEYAVEAFEFEVADFLLKPLKLPRFTKAVGKAMGNHERLNTIALASKATELYVRSDGRLTRIPYDSILYFENVGDYIKVITEKGNHIIYGALKSLADRLSHPRFLKVHRSYIVNLDRVVDIEDNSIVIDKKIIPISRGHKAQVLSSINII